MDGSRTVHGHLNLDTKTVEANSLGKKLDMQGSGTAKMSEHTHTHTHMHADMRTHTHSTIEHTQSHRKSSTDLRYTRDSFSVNQK